MFCIFKRRSSEEGTLLFDRTCMSIVIILSTKDGIIRETPTLGLTYAVYIVL